MTALTDSSTREIILDRHHLHNVRCTFLNLNDARLALAKQQLEERQRIVLDILPALLHFNHPMLPGYLSRNTPFGLYNFTPSAEQLTQLKNLTRSFRSNQKNNSTADILSLFSMGSLGTIAQNSKSDIDLWLCYRPDLDDNALSLLEEKCERIGTWAKTLDLDVSLFLMNNQAFRLSKKLEFNKEASGSTQHYLLLDEFYRTAIYLGGQLPAWIFISPEQEAQYTQTLKQLTHKRLLPEKTLIDFGHIDTIPTSEFISSAIWQLYKAIDSPYKSIIKLLILEIYCKNLSKDQLLSSNFKRQLHSTKKNRIINIWETDPYIEAYEIIENYLYSTHQDNRLDFLRRCFYFKLESPLTKSKKIFKKNSILLEMVKTWGWNHHYIQHLDNHKNWSLKEVLEERRLIVAELNHSYHFIMDFFRSRKTKIKASNRELNILGRKLHAAFSRKAGKIDWVNPIPSANITESTITLEYSNNSKLWTSKNKADVIAKKSNFIELITWLHCNQIIAQNTRIIFNNKNIEIGLFQSLRRFITSLLPVPIKAAHHQVFEKNCNLKKLLFFIDYNIINSNFSANDKDIKNITHFQCDIDLLSINSWNEIICERKQGMLLDIIIQTTINGLQREQQAFNPDIFYNHPNRYIQQQLKRYLEPLLINITSFFKEHSTGRYISYIEDRYLLITVKKNQATLTWLSTTLDIKKVLSEILDQSLPIGLDPNNMADHPLAIFVNNCQASVAQVFFRPRGQDADITFIDELGVWYEFSIDYHNNTVALQALHHFLRSINARDISQSIKPISPLDILPISFYQIAHTHTGWQAKPQIISSQVSGHHIAVYAIAEHTDTCYQFTLHCEGCTFAEPIEGPAIYQRFREFINEQKSSKTIEGFYIADLDLSRCQHQLCHSDKLHTSHYLQLKSLLEENIRGHTRGNAE